MSSPSSAPGAHVFATIIGSGFGGLGTAIRLKQMGIHDLVVLERADDVGGTWRDNSYPGCACDVESHLYSFSFALNPDWTHRFSRQPEIWEYLQRCVREYELEPHLRFGHEVTAATWNDAAGQWEIETTRGRYTSSILVMATGPLSEPVLPSLPGLERFRGIAFHSARWRHDYDLTGKRVAVVGTGASAIQFIPEIQPRVERLHVFQRTAPWVIPRPDRRIPRIARAFYRLVPPAQRLVRSMLYLFRESLVFLFRSPRRMRRAQRIALLHLARAVKDPALRAKLTPPYTMGCKRVLLSNDYLPSLTRPNVEVVTTRIAEVRETSIVDVEGVEREIDAIIFGTGFRPTSPPLAERLVGREGRTLASIWEGSPHAHLGTTVHGFPNLFILLGPNTGLGHTSVVYMIEAQLEHLTSAVRYMRRHGVRSLEPRAAAQAAFVGQVDRRMRGTVWTAGGCASWYLDRTGRNSTLWPDFTWRFRRRVAELVPDEYAMTPAPGAP